MISTSALALLAAPLALVAAPAAAASPDLVISEVYGAGGNTGATHDADFVELYNPTQSPVSLAGLSLMYRSQAGTTGTPFALSGEVAAGDHYLVQMSAPGANGAPLTGVDATANPTVSMAASDGQVLLLNSTTAFTGSGDVAGNAAIRDMVGYGDGAATFEGARTGVDLTSATSAQRYVDVADSDDNAADFHEAAPTPGEGVAAPEDLSVAEIQGTGAASPVEGDYVRTTGVMTARYATGGYDGAVIQTGGTPDTPGASDAVFVYAPGAAATLPPIGTSVEVVGEVDEYFELTQVVAESVSVVDDLPAVTPLAVPWTDLDSDAEREAYESELVAPQGPFTVTDAYNVDNFGEIGLAAGEEPLVVPTEVEDAQTGDPDAVAAENARRAITLDDGATINFRDAANSDTPYPWLTPTTPVRVGAAVTFADEVLLDYRFGEWKLQPQRRVTGDGAAVATFENTRSAAPEEVGGDLRLATFNVLNFFPTTGVEFDALPGTTCTYYRDRDGERTTVNACNPNGPRGAADPANLARQQAKIVEAINALDASVVSLEELENSAKFGKNRDYAIGVLVDALNADAGAGTWAFVPSPPSYDRPTVAQEDVIRTGFIYKPADIERVGTSEILVDEENFDNAREPLAQVFRPVVGGEGSEFVVVVNHFKSKGSGADDGTGQGLANPDRIGQAEALSGFAAEFAEAREVEAVFLAGDFNSYTEEDPMQVLYEDGYANLGSTTDPGEASYSFEGLSGSLDHVVANPAAEEMVTGVDVWNINAEEAVAYEYSRYNSNVTQLYAPTPYKASDHNPEVVGLDVAGFGPEDVQILATNDFHGRIVNDPGSSAAGAAVLAGAVKQLRDANDNTVFAAAGDLIGASTFESFIANDKPTIDALNEAGLEVSAVGNHEFDQGYDDLVNRVMAPESEANPEGGAEWQYLGANVKFRDDGSDALDGTWIKEMDGVQVGFVGTVTEHLPELVSPEGISEIEVTDIVEATNDAADDLVAEGADVVVMLVHEGAPGTDCATMDDDPASDFGSIITGVNDNVDAIVSGHTHLEYNCSFPVAGWADRAVTERPVVSAGQYGSNLNQLVFSVDSATGEVLAKTQSVLKLKAANAGPANYPADPATQAIVDAAVAAADVLGAVEVGELGGGFQRAKLADGTTENRGGESTLGNLVAEVQRWATESETAGAAQIAFMNPGGLRADLVGTGTGAYPRSLTYKQAATVQPFANTLVNMDLTGAQIEEVLEEQWQPAGASRPFLRLGASEGFTYAYTPPATAGAKGEVTGMWLDGVRLSDTETYSVTVNSFLAAGGDGFTTLAEGTGRQDTGVNDLQAMVDYLEAAPWAEGGEEPLPVDFSQRSVGASFPAGAPETYAPGDTVTLTLSSLSMTGPGDTTDPEVSISVAGEELGTAPVTTTRQAALPGFDEAGTAPVEVTLPADLEDGELELVVTGEATGTEVRVPITISGGELATPTMTVEQTPGRVFARETRAVLDVSLSADSTVTGQVRVEGRDFDRTRTLSGGTASFRLARFDRPGDKVFRVTYLGNEELESVTQRVTVTVRPPR